MDPLSSSFLSTGSTRPPLPLSLSPPPSPFRIVSVRNEEKPQTVTSTTKRSSQDRSKWPTITSNNKKRVRKSVKIDRLLLSMIFNAFDDIINKFIDPPIRDSVNPRHVLLDNFYPVDELPPTDCEVSEGMLPSCLDGVYFRNGPNPQFLPRGPYHLFNGDGMLHAIRISKGKATLCSRYVKTNKYNIEKDAGFPMIPNVLSGFNGLTASVARMAVATLRVLAGHFDPSKGIGSANTSLAFFGNKLYALGESDLPYAIKLAPDGDIITLGRHDFDGKLSMRMTAHPKIDPVTKEAFGFRYSSISPFLTFFRFNEKGEKHADVPIFSMRSPCFLHDFAITKNYAIFSENQLKMELFGNGPLIKADLREVPRVGVIRRDAKDESKMKWFQVSGWNILHTINAWEEDGGDTVVMVATNILSIEHLLERMDLMHPSVEKLRINIKTGMVTRHPLSARNLELCVINPAFGTIKNRYIYCGIADQTAKISGVVKLDMALSEVHHQECIVACRMFGSGYFGGEPFFVAKELDNPDADEDDGYIVSLVHNENTDESRFLVMDAKSPTLEIVCVVKLPHRVPYGFHGLFVKESDIKKL
ncbi:probable carotenoid cleavage dioxygenase 4, chloroplastic [Cynara cardunculus var. scolymus]|uniref:probable carotenoid cleavage dioxygenase 4, chloroplastic n=1 Tax=Cynara cardunculus var. scolymus TaxID=59895 RepID=UPI000D62BDA5|nr:probable carotenoid cleavage dioxygenase 4, chloroplastic [Cynara cardunculus var. scolymus]